MNKKIKENISLKGILHYQVFKNEVLIEEVTEENLIVDKGLELISKLLAGEENLITKVGVGTNGTAPTNADLTLTNSYIKNIKSYSFPSNGSVKFDWEFENGEANGKNIQELGLLTTDGNLFSRRIRGSLEKESDIVFRGDWEIQFIR